MLGAAAVCALAAVILALLDVLRKENSGETVIPPSEEKE